MQVRLAERIRDGKPVKAREVAQLAEVEERLARLAGSPAYSPSSEAPAPLPTRCVAKTKRGTDCRNPPVPGATVCKFHGGYAPQVRAKAARRLAADRVRRSLADIEIREVDNPLFELRALTGEVIAWKDALASHVAALEDTYRFTSDEGAEHLDARVALYERGLDRAGRFLEMWARLGIDAMLAEMQVRVTEGQVAAMGRGLDAYRLAAGVSDEAHQEALAAMAKAMAA